MSRLWLLALLAAVACDSRAKASDPSAAASRSKEYESCGASSDCQEDLRCFDHVCRRTARSAVGDYFAALGAQKRAAGDLAGAIDAYNRALGHYDSEKVPLPPDIDCAYGATLAADKATKEHAELGARVLHRCMLAVPVGSSLRDRALAALATLNDAGLDPLALGRTQLADVYLTRAPAAPATDKLQISVTANPQPSGKSYQAVPDAIAAPDMRPALVACWQAYNTATHKNAMTVAVEVKSTYAPSMYEDESGTYSFKVEPPAVMPPGPDQAAAQCVHAAVDPVLGALKTVHDTFETRLAITVK